MRRLVILPFVPARSAYFLYRPRERTSQRRAEQSRSSRCTASASGPAKAADPVARAVAAAPPDDEPVTDEDRRRFHDGQDWFQRHGGEGVPMEEVLSEFGLKPEDFPSEHPS